MRCGRGRSPNSTATRVYERVRTGGERYWSLSDFRDLPATAVAHALSRLASQGELQRLRNGPPAFEMAQALVPITTPISTGAE